MLLPTLSIIDGRSLKIIGDRFLVFKIGKPELSGWGILPNSLGWLSLQLQ
ncbi:MAG: hypothetical protein ACRC8K_07405 [Waterburya sp.]